MLFLQTMKIKQLFRASYGWSLNRLCSPSTHRA